MIPQTAFSSQVETSARIARLSGYNLGLDEVKRTVGYEHFSQALGLVEEQFELSEADRLNFQIAGLDNCRTRPKSRWPAFRALCTRDDILFFGGKIQNFLGLKRGLYSVRLFWDKDLAGRLLTRR